MKWQEKLFVALQYVVPQRALSRAAGWLANSHTTWVKNAFIRWFVKTYDVDMSQAVEEDPTAYYCFNDFFTRALKPEARPVCALPHSIACPTDGVISQIGDIEDGRIFQAKGQDFTLLELLGGKRQLADMFAGGTFANVYLSPRDYHRVHMPLRGTLRSMVHVPGDLFSVNKTTAAGVPRLFARNERVICVFDTEAGPMALVLVGAMIVASIATVWAGQVTPPSRHVQTHQYANPQSITLDKGAEMGRFYLGSTVLVLFGEKRAKWANFTADTLVSMGQSLGDILAQERNSVEPWSG
jgi:phosphatidylserine decarboxylase